MKVLIKLKITSDVRIWRFLTLAFVFGKSTCVQVACHISFQLHLSISRICF
ncbi:hypothetical protein HanPSC8_Chr16g0741621 [Helianthus annuus]|nr:hypothetical protein HanPSC8_Chr16g0741621 [Helianthus annuus]